MLHPIFGITPKRDLVTTQLHNVKVYGAKGDGATDDRAAINAADAAAAINGGIVFYPPGTYVVGFNETVSTEQERACINVSSGVWHVGSGPGATTVKTANSADASMFVLSDTVDSGIFAMEIDGNRSNQTAGNGNASPTGTDPQGIKAFNTVTRLTLHNLHIHHTHDYGIGIQANTATDCDIGHIRIDNVGADGIDAKNSDSNSTGNRLHNIVVHTINLQAGPGAAGQQAAINTRGGWELSNIHVFNLLDDEVGIRFNGGEVGQAGGLSQRNTLTNFFIQAGASATTIGIMADARETMVSNGVIVATNIGIQVRQRENAFSNIVIDSVGNDALKLVSNGQTTDPIRNLFCNIMIRAAADSAIDLSGAADHNNFVNVIGRSCDRGIILAAGATDNQFIGGEMTSMTTTLVSDSGTRTVFRHVGGLITEKGIKSGTFAIDSTGTKIVTIAHGLDFAPLTEQCQLTLIQATDIVDFELKFIRISSVDATNVVADVEVVTASGFSNAVARLSLHVAIKAP